MDNGIMHLEKIRVVVVDILVQDYILNSKTCISASGDIGIEYKPNKNIVEHLDLIEKQIDLLKKNSMV